MSNPAKPHMTASTSLELRSNIYQTTAKASRPVSEAEANALAASTAAQNGRTITYSCDTCGVDCTPIRYHSLKVKNFELCPPCYLDGRFPSNMFSGDFVKLTSANASAGVSSDDDEWSDQEVLLLLEGVEMFDDDWTAIEEHVGTRSAHQCIRKFLELPIEDPYLERESEAAMGPLRYARVPFEKADNPIMSVVAFLAGVIEPGPVADAAGAALHELTDRDETEKRKGTDTVDKDGDQMDSEMKEGGLDSKMATPVPKIEPNPSVAPTPTAEATSSEAPHIKDANGPSGSNKPVARSRASRAADLALNASAKAASALGSKEEAHIRSTLTTLVKLTLTKLELKMAQFEEMEELLEEERRNLETARVGLVAERQGIKRVLEGIRAEMTRNGSGSALPPEAYQAAIATGSQGTKVTPVGPEMLMQDGLGPVTQASYQPLV